MPPLVPEILQLLRTRPLVRSLRVVEHDETPLGRFILKVRCQLRGEYQSQLWLHREPDFQSYAYQLFTDRPLLRWDNAPHYPHVPTAPHHFHDISGTILDSNLVGDPLADLPIVLDTIETFLTCRE